MPRTSLLLLSLLTMLAACAQPVPPRDVDALARDYVVLVLAAGEHDANFVDAFYGPEELKAVADADTRTIPELREAAVALRTELAAIELPADGLARLRHRYLDMQLGAVATRLGMVRGEAPPFDDETRRLYDAVAPAPFGPWTVNVEPSGLSLTATARQSAAWSPVAE